MQQASVEHLKELSFRVHRDDQNHAYVSGNKLHKLAPFLAAARRLNIDQLVSFGGPYSNHLHALAWAAMQQGLHCHGFVRGELNPPLTDTLQDCQRWGMQLKPLTRVNYRVINKLLHNCDAPILSDALNDLIDSMPNNALVIPEGGSSVEAVYSLRDAYQPVFDQPQNQSITHVVCATGTGATVAGLTLATPKSIRIIGVQAVAEGDATIRRIESWVGTRAKRVQIVNGHLGGFAKMPSAYLRFIEEFEREFQIPLDPVYNGKVFYKLATMAANQQLKPDHQLLVIHTGGLQGKRGLN